MGQDLLQFCDHFSGLKFITTNLCPFFWDGLEFIIKQFCAHSFSGLEVITTVLCPFFWVYKKKLKPTQTRQLHLFQKASVRQKAILIHLFQQITTNRIHKTQQFFCLAFLNLTCEHAQSETYLCWNMCRLKQSLSVQSNVPWCAHRSLYRNHEHGKPGYHLVSCWELPIPPSVRVMSAHS